MVASSGIFENVVFSIEFPNSYSYKQKKRLKQAVTEQGGSLSFFLNKKCQCHLMEENTPVTSKASKSLQLKIPVLKFSFILDAIKNGRLPNDTSFYEIFGPSSQLRGGKICASTQTSPTNILQHKLRLFKRANSCAVDDANFKGGVRIPEERLSVLKWIAFKAKDITVLELQQCQPRIVDISDTSKCPNEPRRYQIQLSSSNSKNVTESDRFWATDSLEEAADVYAKIAARLEAKKATASSPTELRRELQQPKHSDMGSLSFQRLIGRADYSAFISPTVLQLVEWLWTEAVSFVNSVAPVSSFVNLKQNKLDEAESLLHSAKALLVNIDIDDDRAEEQANKLSEMSAKINECFSLKSGTILLRSLKVICRLLDFCQVIRDLIFVGEVTNWQRQPTPQAMLNALHCELQEVAKESETFSVLEMRLKNDLPKLDVKAVFRVKRPLEAAEFSRVSRDLSNHQQLYHGSKLENIIGILFRGLIMPKEVETAFGIQRTDEGHLGSGIYFSDCFTTTAKYCTAGSTVRLRVATINDVALGNVFETKQHMVGISSPPESFQSIHGVKHLSENASQFKDDEFAIYSKSQQTLRYLVVFALPEDSVGSAAFYKLLPEPQLSISPATDLINVSNISSDETSPVTELDLGKADSPQKSGLICGDDSIPLKELHVRANIVDLISEVVIYQAYENPYDGMVEVKYVFPLDDSAAVCGFEAFINGKHVIGRVEEKQAARKEYKDAVEKGHGAYLMEVEKRDVFTISIGNLPPKCTVIIKLTYIAELCYESDGSLLFNLPASIANWDQDSALANSEGTQNQTESVVATALSLKTSLTASVLMPQAIRQIRSPSHSIKVKKTETKAVVELSAGSSLDSNFSLLISIVDVNTPRMWVEENPIGSSEACMLVFYPEFEAAKDPLPEITILLDMSNSMQAASESAKLVALGLLRCCVVEFGENCLLNVACFGSYYHECFPSSQRPSEPALERMRKYIQLATPNMGDTDFFSAVEACSAKPHEMLRNICIITDGHAHNESESFELCRRFKNQLRLFTLGISETANRHFLKTLARTSGGACEMFQESMKYKWSCKLKQQVRKLAEPCVSDVRVQWKNLDDDQHAENHKLTNSGGLCSQAPAVISSIFSHERLIVYGMIPHCLEATLWVTVDGKELSTSVFASDLAKTYGQTLHKLTANAIISDWNSGTLHTDKINHEVKKREYQNAIVELSKRYSVVCPLTSFVAVEEREKDETFVSGSVLRALLEAHTNDILPYVSWPEMPSPAESQTVARSSTKKVQIIVKTLTGKSISFETFHSQSVRSIKQKILDSEGIPLDQQRLIFAGRQLNDNCSLADYDMKTDNLNELHLVLRLRGADTKDLEAHSEESKTEPLAEQAAGRTQKKLLSIQSSGDDAECVFDDAETSLPTVLDQTWDASAYRWVWDVVQEQCEASDSADARDKRDLLVARNLMPCGLYGGSYSDHGLASVEKETTLDKHERDILTILDASDTSSSLLMQAEGEFVGEEQEVGDSLKHSEVSFGEPDVQQDGVNVQLKHFREICEGLGDEIREQKQMTDQISLKHSKSSSDKLLDNDARQILDSAPSITTKSSFQTPPPQMLVACGVQFCMPGVASATKMATGAMDDSSVPLSAQHAPRSLSSASASRSCSRSPTSPTETFGIMPRFATLSQASPERTPTSPSISRVAEAGDAKSKNAPALPASETPARPQPTSREVDTFANAAVRPARKSARVVSQDVLEAAKMNAVVAECEDDSFVPAAAGHRRQMLCFRRAKMPDDECMTSSYAATSSNQTQRFGLTSDVHQVASDSLSSFSFGSAPESRGFGSNLSTSGALFGAPPLQPTFGSNVSASDALFGASVPPQPTFGSNVFALGAPFRDRPPPPPQMFGSNVSTGNSLFGGPPIRPMAHAFMQQQQRASSTSFGGFGSSTVAAGQFQAPAARGYPAPGVAAFGLNQPTALFGVSSNVSADSHVFGAPPQPQTATLSSVPFAMSSGFAHSQLQAAELFAHAAATVCPASGFRGGFTPAGSSFGLSSNVSQTSSPFGGHSTQPFHYQTNANMAFSTALRGMTPTTAATFGPPTSLTAHPSIYPFAAAPFASGPPSVSVFGPPASSKQSAAETFQFPRGKDLQMHLFGSSAQQPDPRARHALLLGSFEKKMTIIPPHTEHPPGSVPTSEGTPAENAIVVKKPGLPTLTVSEVLQMFQINENILANQQLQSDATEFFHELWDSLADRGLASFGARVQSEMKTMFQIIVAVFILNLQTKLGFGVSLEATSIELGLTTQQADTAKSLHLDVEWIEQQFKTVWRNAILPNVSEFGCDKSNIKQTVRAAKDSCIEVYEKHSLLCYELELGRNIREMIYSLIGGSA